MGTAPVVALLLGCRADRGDGQPLGAQGRSGSAARGGCRARALVPAALLARHEPHRGGLLHGEGTLRKAGSRTRDALVEATGRALDAIAPEEIRGFYADCGYRLPLQSAVGLGTKRRPRCDWLIGARVNWAVLPDETNAYVVGDGVSEELSRVKVGKDAVSRIASRLQDEQREWRERSLDEKETPTAASTPPT